jgi:hypothetical protein
LGSAATNQAFAWGYWNDGDGGGYHNWGIGGGYENSFCQQPGPGAYENGQSDAVYDRTNNLAYNPVGQCLPCHSQLYWNGFHEGYDKQWNNYQSTSQSTNVYLNNSPGAYLNTDQNSGQSSGPSPFQGLCGSFGCGGPDP